MELPPIGTITVELTRRCHRRCSFCYVTGRTAADDSRDDELPVDVIGPAVAKLVRDTGCRRLQLSGGEPLLRPDLLPLIDAFRSSGASVSIITDGAHLDAELARELADRHVGPIQPTLLAGSAAIHDHMRGEGAFAATARAIAIGSRAGLEVVVCMVITRLNWEESARVAELAFALGARRFALSRLCPAGAARPSYDSLMPDAAQVRRATEFAAAMCRSLRLPLAAAVAVPSCVWSDPDTPPLSVGVCSIMGPRTTMTIGPDGTVRSCSMSDHVVGSLLTEDSDVLRQRLWDQELAPMRAAAPGPCGGCPHYAGCLGGCRLSACAVFGDLSHADPLAPCAGRPQK